MRPPAIKGNMMHALLHEIVTKVFQYKRMGTRRRCQCFCWSQIQVVLSCSKRIFFKKAYQSLRLCRNAIGGSAANEVGSGKNKKGSRLKLTLSGLSEATESGQMLHESPQ